LKIGKGEKEEEESISIQERDIHQLEWRVFVDSWCGYKDERGN